MIIKFLQAFNGDCILISSDKDCPINILIDGGTAATYYDDSTNEFGELKKVIDQIKSKGEYINLLILTHIDNDHICGLLKWFEMDEDASSLIKNVWFNSGKKIAELLKDHENDDLRVTLKKFQSSFTGVSEAIDFETYLVEKGIWDGGIVDTEIQYDSGNVKIEVLSPGRAQLEKLLKEYKRKVKGSYAYTKAKSVDWQLDLKSLMEEENDPQNKFVQDDSPKNGSSIAFILTLENRKLLFLGDSHPKVIIESLLKLGFSENKKLEVDFVKLSHHGSKKNISIELLKMINTNDYIISTDSMVHGHPNKRALARILNVNPNATFHFNYKNVKDFILVKKDFDEVPGFNVNLISEFK